MGKTLKEKPVIGITMGDPAGIGAEVIVKALEDPTVRGLARFVIYGSNAALVRAAEGAGVEPRWWRVGAGTARAREPFADTVVVVDFADGGQEGGAGAKGANGTHSRGESAGDFKNGGDGGGGVTGGTPGPTRHGGEASLAYLNEALWAAMLPVGNECRIDAMVTGPIAKASWHLAGLKRFGGHTELLADRTGTKRFAMMFVAPKLRVVLATTHIPLMQVRNVLTIGKVYDPIDLGHEACRRLFGIERPRIAVCGLNPHASEGGLFGDDEYRVIEPAIRQAVEQGIDVSGPFPADTVFLSAMDGRFDLVVAMYHDQGLIPVKTLARDEAVNVTIGLPIIRTSPDHGTAFDIAGRSKANPGSMKAAIRLAAVLAAGRRAKSVESGHV